MASHTQSSGAQPIRQPLVGSTGLPQNFGPLMPLQFRTAIQTQPAHQFIPPPTQQIQPLGQGMPPSNIGMPQIPHFAHATQQIISTSGQPGQGPVSSQTTPVTYIQPSRPVAPNLVLLQQSIQFQNNNLLNVGGMGMPLSSSYTFSTSYGQQPNSVNGPAQYQPVSLSQAPGIPAGGQPWSASLTQSTPHVTPWMQVAQQSSVAVTTVATTNAQPSLTQQSSNWQEHRSSDGKRYYYNKKTKQSSWEKPLELMTPLERADASTAWKEYATPEGRKYYYNKVTKQSKWIMPDEVKIAREQAENGAIQTACSEIGETSLAPSVVTVSSVDVHFSSNATSNGTPMEASAVAISPQSVNLVNAANPLGKLASGSPPVADVPPPEIASLSSTGTTNATVMLNVSTPVTQLPALSSTSLVAVADIKNATTAATKSNHDNSSFSSVWSVPDGAPAQDMEEVKRDTTAAGKINVTLLGEKAANEEPLTYVNKLEAKTAFKNLLESGNIESDWTWEQAMRVIINDKRYGALRTLGERKQAFNEYLSERKKHEAEERRIKQKKAREEFTRMLAESGELSSSTRWSKAVTMFESDERFNAVERAREREDLFEAFLAELQKKERVKAAEEHMRNIMEYRALLESCDFIKANSQWRKVQDRLEGDERCSRLDKFDRLKIFQDYIHDLEKEEEEQQKIQKEQLRRTERKNRDEFRKLMEGHVAAGILTAKTHWRDYYMEVKDLPSYLAVSSNTSGATPKDLFEDVAEELEKQYHEDKTRIKDALKIGKIALTLSSTFENFKADFPEDDFLKRISEVNLKLIYDELLEKLRDKEEKEAKRRKRIVDNFSNLLYSSKEISASSTWAECKSLFEDCQELSSIGDESIMRDMFEEYVARLREKVNEEHRRDEGKAKKEKGRGDKGKRKERKEEDREHEKERGKRQKDREHEKEKGKRRSRKEEVEGGTIEGTGNFVLVERERGNDKDRKHHKRHGTTDEVNSEKDGKEKSKKSHRHSSDRKKSRKYAHTTESDSENWHRRQKKERDGSHRNDSCEELEDGELGEDLEIC